MSYASSMTLQATFDGSAGRRRNALAHKGFSAHTAVDLDMPALSARES
jgi:hypothetical protein